MDRKELNRRLHLLKAKIDEGKFHVAPHLIDGFNDSLSRIRIESDGLVDSDSVDGRIRSILPFIAYQADRDEWKEVVSLLQIQTAYYERVERAFGDPYAVMTKAGAHPSQFAGWYASEKERVNDAIVVIDEFVADILEFWESISEPTWIHLEDSLNSKAVFAGELFPDSSSNLASSTGIYFDTTILPDPFVKISPLLQLMDEAKRVEEVTRLALQVLQYRDLALADLSVPVVAVLPDRFAFDENYQNFINSIAEKNTLTHCFALFERPFDDLEDLKRFLHTISEPDDLVRALRKPEEVLFATEWAGSLSEHIQRYIEEQSVKLGITRPGDALYLHMVSRFSQANDSFQRSRELRGTPVIRAETSWRWFNWMLRENSLQEDGGNLVDLHINRALQTTVHKELTWLGAVPPDALLDIRRAGALDEIRSILSQGITELVEARPSNFFRTGDQVFENLSSAFSNHEKQLAELRDKKWTFAGRDIGSFLVVGGIELAAALTGAPLFGAVAATAGMTGTIPTAKELREKLKALRTDQSKLESSGIGILFGHRE